MKERLKCLRENLGLNQEIFGEKIGITRSHISSLENGARNITDRVITDVCRELNVNETWLRTGEGEMYNSLSQDEELAFLMGKVMGGNNQFMKDALLTLAKLDEKEWDFIESLIHKLKGSTK